MKTFEVQFVEGGEKMVEKECKAIAKEFRKLRLGNIRKMDIQKTGGFMTLHNYNENQLLESEFQIAGATLKFANLPSRDPEEEEEEEEEEEKCKGWKAPKKGWLKYNVDGAFDKHTKDGGIGGLLRNYKREWLDHFSEYRKAEDNNLMELLAIERALESITEKYNDKKVIIETDSRNVSKWMKGTESPPKEYQLLHYYRALRLLQGLKDVYIQFQYGKYNTKADELAKAGKKKAESSSSKRKRSGRSNKNRNRN